MNIYIPKEVICIFVLLGAFAFGLFWGLAIQVDECVRQQCSQSVKTF